MALGTGDCERLHDGLIAQPVNTASALAYVAVGAWVTARALRAGASGRPGPARAPAVAFGLAVAAAGIGSVDYHGPGSPAARLLHDGGLYAVVGLVAWHEAARRVGQARRAGTGAPGRLPAGPGRHRRRRRLLVGGPHGQPLVRPRPPAPAPRRLAPARRGRPGRLGPGRPRGPAVTGSPEDRSVVVMTSGRQDCGGARG